MIIKKQMLAYLSGWCSKQIDIPEGWIYLGDEKERYVLGQPGKRNMLVFGVNPSTASAGENNLDPTIKKVIRTVKQYGCDGWIMVNLYPLRSADPQNLPDEANKELIRNNIKVIKAIQDTFYIERIWAAWGDIIDTRFYLGDTLYDIQEEIESDQWFYKGKLTKKGNPRHPLYLKIDEPYEWFPVADYAANWRYSDIML